MPQYLSAIVLSAAMGISGVALAQTTPQQTQPRPPSAAPPEKVAPRQAPGSSAHQSQWHMPKAGEMRASKLIGSSVKNTDGDTIGEINEVIIGKDGKVAAVVVGVGGFLGIGEREVAVNFESLQISGDSSRGGNVVMKATKESLRSAPEWKWRSEGNRGGTGSTPNR